MYLVSDSFLLFTKSCDMPLSLQDFPVPSGAQKSNLVSFPLTSREVVDKHSTWARQAARRWQIQLWFPFHWGGRATQISLFIPLAMIFSWCRCKMEGACPVGSGLLTWKKEYRCCQEIWSGSGACSLAKCLRAAGVRAQKAHVGALCLLVCVWSSSVSLWSCPSQLLELLTPCLVGQSDSQHWFRRQALTFKHLDSLLAPVLADVPQTTLAGYDRF